MSPSTLYLTTGGSHQPLVTAIQALKPDRVVFFCTGRDPATGRPGSRTQIDSAGLCIKAQFTDDKPTLPNIPAQCGLRDDQFEVVEVPADDFDTAYALMHAAMTRQAQAGLRWADYTGGTKTMTAALVAVALDLPDIELRLVAGSRANLVKVEHGSQYSMAASVGHTRFERELRLHLSHWATHDYGAAAAGLLRMTPPAHASLRADWQRALHWSDAFAAWDRFGHTEALEKLAPYQARFAPAHSAHWNSLRELADPQARQHTPLKLWDLLLNAERRAMNHRFDDATARIYRLLEWTAQWQLEHQCGWRTADLPAEVATAAGIVANAKGRYQTGLRGAWQLLGAHGGGAAATFFAQEGERMLEQVLKRNHSILAHGEQPLSAADWLSFWQWVQTAFRPLLEALLRDGGVRQLHPQLPTKFCD